MADPPTVQVAQDMFPTDNGESLQDRVAFLDAQLAAAEQENARLESQHANLSASFAQVQRELSELSASSKFIAAAKDAVDTELAEEKQKREAAEELVEVLRGKVDDARKAFGTLQKQDRRASTMFTAADGPALDALGLSSLDDTARSKTSKRTSILFGASARRPSNASDHDHPTSTAMLLSPPQILSATTPTLPQAPVNAKGLRSLRLSSAPGASAVSGGAPPSPSAAVGSVALEIIPDGPSKRWSGMSFGAAPRSSPARGPNREDAKPDMVDTEPEQGTKRQSRPSPDTHRESSSSEVDLSTSPPIAKEDRSDALFLEIAQLRAQLEESKEARVASEECLKALREFIATSNGGSTVPIGDATADGSMGLAGIKLPPLPTDRDVEGEEEQMRTPQQDKKSGATGWSLGRWRASGPTQPVPAAPQSISTSTRSEAGDIRSATPSAAQSPASQHDKLPPPGIPPPADEGDAQNPLRSFVSSWSKAIPAGTPKVETPPTAVPAPAAKKGFSFFTRSSSDRDMAAGGDEPFVPKDVSRPGQVESRPENA